GFSSVQVEQQGEEVRLSFQLQEGATVHLSKGFNRLELVFTISPQVSAAETSASAAATRSNVSTPPITSDNSDDRETLRQMRAQMEQLEARIKELEGKQSKADVAQTAPQVAPVVQ